MKTRLAVRAGVMIGSAAALVSFGASVVPAQAVTADTRPATVISIASPSSSGNTFTFTGVLRVKSSGKVISGAVVYLLEDGSYARKGTTNSNGKVTFTYTVPCGDDAVFHNYFPGNNSYVSSISIGFGIDNLC